MEQDEKLNKNELVFQDAAPVRQLIDNNFQGHSTEGRGF